MQGDAILARAADQVEGVRQGRTAAPAVRSWFDEPTSTASHVAYDPATRRAAIIDSVLNFDVASGRTSTASADAIIAFVQAEGLTVDWILETHLHADHLSAASYLQEKLGGKVGIGRGIRTVQTALGHLFNEDPSPDADDPDFDALFEDGDDFAVGGLQAMALHVPGHTPTDLAYVIGDAAFVGDTIFMPDYGTARADFPGGDARTLYRSIRRLLGLPGETRLFLCHDYKAPGRDSFAWETTVAAQRAGNVHVHDGVAEDEFVAMREARDAKLSVPRLILPSLQVNMRAGHLPRPESNGTRYLKLPLNLF